MPRPNFFITEDNTAPPYQITCTRNGATMDLSSASGVTVIIQRKSDGTITQTGKAATITTASSGIISYSADVGDFPQKGIYVADIKVTYGDGTIEILYNQARWKVRTRIQ